MNAIEAVLEPLRNAEPAEVDGPEQRLLSRIALAERQYAEGKCTPADEAISRLYAIADRA